MASPRRLRRPRADWFRINASSSLSRRRSGDPVPDCSPVNPKRAIAGVFIMYWLVKGLLWSVVTPPWQAPDEPTHFAQAYRLSGGQVAQTELERR
ncbi:DUF2142 domain-containing protein, partial [bacterium]|nr:DUF2142 domain-containing protein [candidate division CSSED10-310 bacterium]